MADYYYGPGSPYYIPAYNQNHNFTSDQPIHPNSAAAQLGLTPEELAPILREQQCEYEFAQPPTQPTAYHNHAIQAKPPQPPSNPAPYVHLQSVAARFGLTPTEIAEIEDECIHNQAEWLAIEDEANRRAREGRELRGEQEETSGVVPETRGGKPEEAEEETDRHRPHGIL